MILEASTSQRFSVDLFCRVIDYFGDAGVCLRLARALVLQHGCMVRLWCDDVALLTQFEPTPPLGLSFHEWDKQDQASPAQGVICGFGCTLNDAYLRQLVACAPQPSYLHLEYLSAQAWVEGTHGLWSTHPRWLSQQRFCNPGFNHRTGGLLHEAVAFEHAQALNTLSEWQAPVPPNALRVFAFAYPTASWASFVAAAAHSKCAIHWVLPHSEAGLQLWQSLKDQPLHTFTRLPMVSQATFDAALRSCQAAWVRGEDSATSAMFSGIPMLWQLYMQDDDAQIVKLKAYLDTVSHALPGQDLSAWREAMQVANAIQPVKPKDQQQAFLNFFDTVRTPHHAQMWAQHCREQIPDLAATVAAWLKDWKIN
jgi:uncharacterized repeat protein (TIGR03837 family)